ncbi:MAG: hypothetical protein ACJ761_08480 [Chloroflexota bacterium]
MVTLPALYRRLPGLSRRFRRLAVIAAFVGFPLQTLGYWTVVAPGRVSETIWGPVSIVLFATTLVGLVVVYGFGQSRIGGSAVLDERQRAMNDRALVLGYGVLTTFIVAVAALIAVYASFVGPITITMDAFTSVAIAIGLYVPALPFAALAWIEPDVPSDDEA